MAFIAALDSPETAQRRDRSGIATQACETCRTRKSKCDEARPKCGLCSRLSADCIYREPLPTKKDKTLVHILDTLTRIESKFDRLNPGFASAAATPAVSTPQPVTLSGINPSTEGVALLALHDGTYGYKQLAVPHKIISWPAIYLHLTNTGIPAVNDLPDILEQGTPWFIKRDLGRSSSLPANISLPSRPIDGDLVVTQDPSRVMFPSLTPEQVDKYCDVYFDTFHVICPILNPQVFLSDVTVKVMQNGFIDGDADSVLLLLVLALGQVGLEGVTGEPLNTLDGTPSGIRGGTADHPPGIEFFNEARRRIGFIMTTTSLENVQIMLLQALYYESGARHLDFWRATIAASTACQTLVRCLGFDWETSYGDLVRRAFWMCIISEDLFHLDLYLPQSGIQSMQDDVPHPTFYEDQQITASGFAYSNHSTLCHYHFLAMLALRRLISDIYASFQRVAPPPHQSEDPKEHSGPPVHVIRELARQVESWRLLLPQPLQWEDSDSSDFLSTSPVAHQQDETLFGPDQSSVPFGHKHNLDIMTAQLRTRFYYARFIIYRPFVYKAIHFPELLTNGDRECCGLAIKAALHWAIAMAPSKNKKRLVPHLFAWTQNFTGVLLMLHAIAGSKVRKEICDGFVDPPEVQQAVSLMLEWIRDVSQVDVIADWSWKLLEPLFSRSV